MKFTIATLLALPFLAAAGPLEARQGAGSCSTGSMQCCNTTVSSNSTEGNILSSLFGLLGPLTGLLGINCSPLNVIGVDAGNDCTAAPVCCTNTQSGGLIGIGCVPISL
ncbi:hydrophobin [Phlebiopsis gigantea 11061_1 CR5-6]|uniref:Hydrophobin n=1 Tax=Phlebiopsis gigantea (strain 11061_1 CR5-6) TaxID=745531 RepID=A0A0C3SF62_PHLG1|nr:hydrophobin [Phlebiopsis gigantea 11061_1 CR5-6]